MRLRRCHLGQTKIHKGEAHKDKNEAIDQRRGTAVCQAEHYQAGDSSAIQAGDDAKGQQEYIHPRTNSHVPIRVQPNPNTEMKRNSSTQEDRQLKGFIHVDRERCVVRGAAVSFLTHAFRAGRLRSLSTSPRLRHVAPQLHPAGEEWY